MSINKKPVDNILLPFIAGTSDLEPLTPPDTDLCGGVTWFKLHMTKLEHSEFLQMATNEEFGAAFKLWMFAIHQVPAGSLPNNEVVLAKAAGYDHRAKSWQRVRGMALYGWVLCSDGRLYHQTVADTVLDILPAAHTRPASVDQLDAREVAKARNRTRQQKFRDNQRAQRMMDEVPAKPCDVESESSGADAMQQPVTPAPLRVTPVTLRVTPVTVDKDKDKDKDKDNVTITSRVTPVTSPVTPESASPDSQNPCLTTTREGALCKQLRALGVRAAPHMVVVQEMCARHSDEHILAAAEVALEKKGAGIHVAYIAAMLKDTGKSSRKREKNKPAAGPPNRSLLPPVDITKPHYVAL